jgi:hypothetical protein
MDTRADEGYAASWATEGTSGDKTVTEEEWLNSTDPRELLKSFGKRVSRRKARLFAVACCRRAWRMLTDSRIRYVLELTEQFADGLVTKKQLAPAYQEATAAINGNRGWFTLPEHAALGVLCAASTSRDVVGGAIDAAQYVAFALGELPSASHVHADLVRNIFGNSFRSVTISSTVLVWNDGLVVRLAQAAYEERHLPAGTLDNGRLAFLADALEEAGCTDTDILGHLRGPGPHVRGCWPLDLCLGIS